MTPQLFQAKLGYRTSSLQTVAWDDMRILASQRQGAGWTAPTLTAFSGAGPGIGLWQFASGADNEICVTAQLPHNALCAASTTLYPHVHWATATATAVGVVRWGFEYAYAAINGTFSNAPTTVTGDYTFSSDMTRKHIMTDIDSSAITVTTSISAIIIGRLYRDTSVASNYADPIYLLEFDLHYGIDSLGSDAEDSKS